METRTCAADDCKKAFVPKVEWEKFCSLRCKNRIHVRRFRARRRVHFPDPPPTPGPPDGGLHATIVGGAVEYSADGSVTGVRYSVKSNTRKPAVPVPAESQGGLLDAA